LVKRYPTNLDNQADLGGSYLNLGIVYQAGRRLPEAEQAFRNARDIFQRLTEQKPDGADHQADLANCHNCLADLYKVAGRSKEAEEAYGKALALHEILTHEHPSITRYTLWKGGTQANLADLLLGDNQLTAAVDGFARAIAVLTPILIQEPRHFEARKTLRRAYAGRAKALARWGRHAEALQDWDRALTLAEAGSTPELHFQRALTLAHLKEHVQATAVADRFAQAKDASADTLHKAACVFSLSAAAADKEKLAGQYAARAVELLRQAIAKGYTDVEDLRKNKDLDALRQREDFRKLLTELAEKGQQAPGQDD
jgi:tetratricopeptide (TPR) repeat protein